MNDNDYTDWGAEHEAVYVAVMSQLEELPEYHDRSFVVLNVIRQLAIVEATRLTRASGVPGPDTYTEVVFQGLCRAWSVNTFAIPKWVRDEPITSCGRCAACVANKAAASAGAAERQKCVN